MTTQFLILRIQSIIDGNVDLNPSQLRAIASEYKRVCEDAERKLVHCASLIKAGRDYAALQVAETEPLLLESINELLFEKISDWRTFCTVNSLPYPPAFDSFQIDLLKSLYTREISQTHPLYRDYRRTMRMHNYDEALSIIRTISKVNKLDAQAKKECEKLEKKVSTQRFLEAKKALLEGNETLAVELATSIPASGKEMFASDPEWIELSKKIEKVELANAKSRLDEILKKLNEFNDSKDFKEILALCAEFDLICSKYSLSVSDSDFEFVKQQTKRASAIQDEILQAQERANASIVLAAEIEHPDELPPSKELLKLKQLAEKSGNFLENELKIKFEKRCKELNFKIKIARAKNVFAFCLIICALSAAALFADKFAKEMRLKDDARREISIMREMSDDSKLAQMLSSFENDYKDFLDNPEFSLPFAKIKDEFEQRKSLEQKIKKDLDFALSFNKKSELAADWTDVFEKLDEAEKSALAFADSRRSSIKDSASSIRRELRNAMNELRNETANNLKNALDFSAKKIADIDVLSDSAFKDIQEIGQELESAKKIADSPNNVFKISPIDADRLAELSVKLQTVSDSISKARSSLRAMKDAENLDEYFAELDRFKSNPNLSAKELMEIENLASTKEFIEKQIYGGFNRVLATQTPEKFSAEGIDFSEKDIAPKMYKCTDGTKIFFVSGKISSRKQSWRGGSEITQTANIISSNGTTNEGIFRMNYTDGMSPRGKSIISNELTLESKVATQAAELSQKDSPIKAIEFVAKSNANPMFKVWLEKKLFDALASNEINSGLAYSPSLIQRQKKVEQLSKELDAHSWIFATSARTVFIKNELYSKDIPNFFEEAQQNKEKAALAGKSPLEFTGFVDSKNNLVLKSENVKSIYGISSEGEWIKVTDATPARRFSPLFSK